MPELKRMFTAGRMNKDIDERLLPGEEYRDALNVGVTNSEGSDIGAVENLKGNHNIPFEGLATPFSTAKTVGAIRYDLEEKIYWFAHTDQGDYVLEYDQTQQSVVPILSDTMGILSFTDDNLITGINILGGQLFWTDNQSEPKKINITKFKEATGGSYNHTQLYGRALAEADITVIKKSPLSAPRVNLFEALEGDGNYAASAMLRLTKNELVDGFTEIIPVDAGDQRTFTVFGNNLAYQVDDQIRLFRDAPLEEDQLEVIATITNLVGNYWTISINTTDQNIPLEEDVLYTISLFDAEVLFELKFPRFAYRWKYEDGEYSVYSAFSETAFLPGDFQYNAEEGYNLGMTNRIRRVVIDGFQLPPDDVVEVDVLYKQSNNTNVYTVETIGVTQTSLVILRDQIHALLPSNQILRPYDNVPRRAKSQEVTANRLVYGNYVHNYDLALEPKIRVELMQTLDDSPRSIKSLRTYQFGVVYQDIYGRQTPVQSNSSASFNVPVLEAMNTNAFTLTVPTAWPSEDFTHYQYYIKETSNEYYNIALDRFYTGDDGFVWLSFPSSEFNKLSSEDYIYLKKGHTTSTPVTAADARYKVLDIQTEAPDFIKRRREVRGNLPYAIDTPPNDSQPEQAAISFDMTVSAANSLVPLVATGNYIRFTDGTNRSMQYEITAVISTPGSGGDIHLAINVSELFGADIDFVRDPTDPTQVAPFVNVEIAEEVVDNLPEFIGRFFVKIILNGTFRTHVIEPSKEDVTPVYGVVEEQRLIWNQLTTSGPGDGNMGMFWDFRNRMVSHRNRVIHKVKDGVGLQQGNTEIHLSQSGLNGPNNYFASETTFHDYLGKTGTFIRFITVEKTGDDVIETGRASETVYEIISVNHQGGFNGQDPNNGTFEVDGNSQDGFGDQNRDGWLAKRTALSTGWFKRWEITLDKPIDFDYSALVTGPTTTGSHNRTHFSRNDNTVGVGIEILQDLSEIGANREGGSPYTADPAIFETEPRGDELLDIYYQTHTVFSRAAYGQPNTLKWYNCFSFGNGVESDRIRDDFNGVRIDKGPRVSATIAEQFREEHRPTGLIWSGIFNSTTGINNTNQFILAEGIQKELQPQFSSIQKLHSRNTDLIAFCEDKVVKILADKDALFNADGSTNLNASNTVLGQTVPFAGEYGISKNPESFATFGTRMYFTDKNRGVILRLSQDGMTQISDKGMEDFFRDLFVAHSGEIVGSYDDYHDKYVVTFSNYSVCYDESVGGWPSRLSYVPEAALTLNNTYYSFKNAALWQHNSNLVGRNNFYGEQFVSSVVFIFNEAPTSVKNFKTLNYEGTQPSVVVRYNINDDPECFTTTNGGWFCPTFITNTQVGDARAFLEKENKWFTNLGVLNGAEAITEILDTFSDLTVDVDGNPIPDDDGADSGKGPLLDDIDILDDMGDDGTEGGGGIGDVTDELDDGEVLGDSDKVEETDEQGNPIDPPDTTITITLN